MTAGTSSPEDQARQEPEADSPERAGLLVSAGDRCSSCGAGMAIDQRYCVECGTRRGNPRFALATGEQPAPAPAVRVTAGWSRVAVILAVIAVLLALGVGVLIGNSTQASIKQPLKVQLSGGSLSSGTAGGGSTSGAAGATTPTTSSSGSSKSCTKGTAGCKHGSQTGNFFGG
ncbi:MAG: hypothetical protein KGL15_00940 [Acidobacteriota bacterium]|nr:hypothetical protein [Acidobacteriota bacterium]